MVKKTKAIKKEADEKIEKVLVENFVSLQKVMTNLAVKFDSLSSQISKLLELFEISAKTLAEKDYTGKEGADKKTTEKLDTLLEQNKILARGIALLHEKDAPETNSQQPFQYLQENRTAELMNYSKPAKIDISNHPRFRNTGQ